MLSAYRLREHVDHLLDLSFTARIGTLMVGSVRQLPICIGDTKALMLGPLTVEPPFRSRGVGRRFFKFLTETRPFDAVALALEVSPGNAAARRLYESVGFRERRNSVLIWPAQG